MKTLERLCWWCSSPLQESFARVRDADGNEVRVHHVCAGAVTRSHERRRRTVDLDQQFLDRCRLSDMGFGDAADEYGEKPEWS